MKKVLDNRLSPIFIVNGLIRDEVCHCSLKCISDYFYLRYVILDFGFGCQCYQSVGMLIVLSGDVLKLSAQKKSTSVQLCDRRRATSSKENSLLTC